MKAANGENYDDVLQHFEGSCYAPDLDFSALRRQLPLLAKCVSTIAYSYMYTRI